jgi:CMP/dCMP kinase
LLDKQIIDLVAARIGAPTAYVQARDENVESFVDRLFRVITSAYPEAYAAEGLPDWSEERMVQLTGAIIHEHAQASPLVVIGRGAPMLLRDRTDALRVFITAPINLRIERLRRRTKCSADDAAKEIKTSDQHRFAYFQQYFGVNWRDPACYDMVLNTEHLDSQTAAALIIEAAQHKSS